MEFILMLIAMFALMYFFVLRPQAKRMKEQQEAVAALQAGDRVLLHSGIFVTVSHVGEAQMIVELAPGTEITILKAAVNRKAREDEEEFVFADEEAGSVDETEGAVDEAEALENVSSAEQVNSAEDMNSGSTK